jgi:iron(III) transport system ATP-binding protein
MDSGNVAQLGTAEEIYKKPANRFVADFIGTMNFIPGEVVEVVKDSGAVYVRAEFKDKILCQADRLDATTLGKTVYVSIRPEDVEVVTQPTPGRENLFKGTIAHKAYLGNFLYFFVSVNGTMIRVQVPHHLPQEEGQELMLSLDPQKCVILS